MTNKEVDAINEIVALGEAWDIDHMNSGAKVFGLGPGAISFTSKNVRKYNDARQVLFDFEKDLSGTLLVTTFEKSLIKEFAENILSKKQVPKHALEAFISSLKALPKIEYRVLRPILGIKLEIPTNTLTLGPYKVFHLSSQEKELETSFSLYGGIWQPSQIEYLIEYTSSAREFAKALELADIEFERFELIVRFLTGARGDQYEVGVLNYQGWRHQRAYGVTSGGQGVMSAQNRGPHIAVPLDDSHFVSSAAGYDRIWAMLSNKSPSKFEQRLLLAIDWVGQALSDANLPNAFLKAAVSLEVLFTRDQKEIITPGILSKLSEDIAIVLGSSFDARMEIERDVKRLYSLRSKIAHAGNQSASPADVALIIAFARSVICELLLNVDFTAIKSIDDLHEEFRRIKYSGPLFSARV